MTDFSERYKKTREMVLNSRIKNPKTGNMVKVSTALKRGHPAYDAARAMVKQYMKDFDVERDRVDTSKKRKKELSKTTLNAVHKLLNGTLFDRQSWRSGQHVNKGQLKSLGSGRIRYAASIFEYEKTYKRLSELSPEAKSMIKSVDIEKIPDVNNPRVFFNIDVHEPAFWKDDDFPRMSNLADRQLDIIGQEFAKKAGLERSPTSKDMQWNELKKKNPKLHKQWLGYMRDLATKEANYLEGEMGTTDNPYYAESIKKFRQLADYFDDQLDPKLELPKPRALVKKPLGPRGGMRWTFDEPEPEAEPQKKSLFKRFFGM